ncbi:MAG TPA: hypothetical protein VF620_05455 [Allosphingosinicella sp.]|jgi:hypothetical protein
MIEIEGGTLLSLDNGSAQMMALLGELGGEAALDFAAMVSEGDGADTLLSDSPKGAGDEWIVSLLSGSSNGALAAGTIGPSDDILLDGPSNADGESEDIVITGRPLTGRVVTNGSGGGGGAEGSGDGGNGGGSTTGTPAVPVAEHTQDCGSDDGAAVQVAKHVKGELPTGVSGPVDPVTTASGNDWSKVEFGTMIVRNSDGSFGALNDMIYSNDLPNKVQINYGTTQPVQGFWHSHPGTNVSSDLKLIGRYPSIDDWQMLDRIKAGAGATSNPSLWIMDAFGVTREFKYDERDYFKDLLNNDAKMKTGEGLDGRERSESCG